MITKNDTSQDHNHRDHTTNELDLNHSLFEKLEPVLGPRPKGHPMCGGCGEIGEHVEMVEMLVAREEGEEEPPKA
jgi:hypothetical protein